MKKPILNFILITLILLSFGYEAKTCTTFCLSDSNSLVFGRNLDFYTGYGHVIVNKRNLKKTAMIQIPEKPFQWSSKYGSLTFNQGGREFPYGGMNEKGLVIEQMWLAETEYPEIDNRFALTELQWIQYQLDNSATVAEVISSDSALRISKLSVAPLHFLICDKGGNVATIEYIKGKMIWHTNTSLPVSVLANDTYEKSKDYIKTFTGFGGQDSIPYTSESFDRFARAASMIKSYHGLDIITYSFEILDQVSQSNATQWSIVYDIKNLTVHYKTKKNQAIRRFCVSDFDFSCASPSLFVDIDENLNNNKLDFKVYSYQKNLELINNAFNNVEFLKSIPLEAREYSARYPETTECVE